MALLPGIFTNGDSVNFLGLLYILGHPELLNQHYQYIYMFNLVNLVMFFLIVCAIVGQPIAKWLFENKAIVYLGKISYGTYVYHLALMQFFFYVVKRVAFVPPSGHFYWLQIVYFIIYMSLLYFISHLSYKYFELYFLKLKNKIK
jgi:peptidoglycan/LPS O-acetylase OafA/YrhL